MMAFHFCRVVGDTFHEGRKLSLFYAKSEQLSVDLLRSGCLSEGGVIARRGSLCAATIVHDHSVLVSINHTHDRASVSRGWTHLRLLVWIDRLTTTAAHWPVLDMMNRTDMPPARPSNWFGGLVQKISPALQATTLDTTCEPLQLMQGLPSMITNWWTPT